MKVVPKMYSTTSRNGYSQADMLSKEYTTPRGHMHHIESWITYVGDEGPQPATC